jgi:2-amino-4-hydroxy-6-hydroxymethyldihydropteridine diphosphokinase
MTVLAYIGLGANLGAARQTLEQAIVRLAALPNCSDLRQSGFYRSAPIASSGDDYVNAVVALNTNLSATDLLHALQQIESDFGRLRPYQNAPRTLDLDLLLYGDMMSDDSCLTLPHPRMHERAFVLLPLLELDAHISIPGRNQAASYLAAVSKQELSRIE